MELRLVDIDLVVLELGFHLLELVEPLEEAEFELLPCSYLNRTFLYRRILQLRRQIPSIVINEALVAVDLELLLLKLQHIPGNNLPQLIEEPVLDRRRVVVQKL